MRDLIRSSPFACLIIAALLLANLPLVAQAKKFPEPSPFPISWELDFKHSAPQRIIVDAAGASTPTAYWYMTYTVTNRSGAERTFFPMFELVAADGKAYKGDFLIPDEVFNVIKKREKNPLLEKAEKLGGELRQGEDQAKDGVVIWKEPPSPMRTFNIYAYGLSGEHVIMKDDDGKTITDKEGPVILRKTLELTYQVRGGTGAYVEPNQIEAKPERWVMR
ncbi:MAG TPA: hypothetical protein VH370_00460 [Humisphaera sp.]|jgi:hypothetical protein|nr:hypothetical protein [Humisphaera sp.]